MWFSNGPLIARVQHNRGNADLLRAVVVDLLDPVDTMIHEVVLFICEPDKTGARQDCFRLESPDLACDFVDLLLRSSTVSCDVIWISYPVGITELSEENIRPAHLARNPAQARRGAVETVVHIQQRYLVLPNGKPGIQLP